MNDDFNDLPWHDASLELIEIDRKQPGHKDTIKLRIAWPDEKSFSEIEFYDCYGFNARMNFGIIALESILDAECIFQDEKLKEICDKWLKMGIVLENLKHYRIITNSTNSVLDIFSMGYNLTNL